MITFCISIYVLIGLACCLAILVSYRRGSGVYARLTQEEEAMLAFVCVLFWPGVLRAFFVGDLS